MLTGRDRPEDAGPEARADLIGWEAMELRRPAQRPGPIYFDVYVHLVSTLNFYSKAIPDPFGREETVRRVPTQRPGA